MLHSPAAREFNRNIKEEISTTGLFSFQQQDLFNDLLYLGTLLPGDINENILRQINYLDYLLILAAKNGVSQLITNPEK